MVFFKFNSFALLFIRTAKFSREPEISSAIAIAQSFPERNIKPYSKSFTLICIFSFNPKVEPWTKDAALETVTIFDKSHFSNAKIQVIIFVVEAIGVSSKPDFSYKTDKVFLSITIACLEFTIGSSKEVVLTSEIFKVSYSSLYEKSSAIQIGDII